MVANKDLEKYVAEARARGMSDYAIRQELLETGWSVDEVNQTLSFKGDSISLFTSQVGNSSNLGRKSITLKFIVIFVFLAISIASSAYLFFSKSGSIGLFNIFKNVRSSNSQAQQVELDKGWREYSDGDYGFSLKYPIYYRFSARNQNDNGYVYPSDITSGLHNLVEIVDTSRNSDAIPHRFFLRLLYVAIKTEEEFDAFITEQGLPSLLKTGVDVTSEKILFAGFPAYKINFFNPTNKATASYIFIYRFGIVLQIDYAPVGDDVFEKIVSSFTFKEITLDSMSDQALYVNGIRTKDYRYCDYIEDINLRDNCKFEIEGPKINEITIDFSKLETMGESYTGTKLSAGPSKGSKAWFASVISLDKGGTWLLKFDVDFVNGESAKGLISVYLNTTQIGQVDGSIHFPDPDYPDYEFLLPVTGPGLFALSFRLDTFADGNTSATIKNAKLLNIENLSAEPYIQQDFNSK